MVTSNHVHLLVLDNGEGAIAQSLGACGFFDKSSQFDGLRDALAAHAD